MSDATMAAIIAGAVSLVVALGTSLIGWKIAGDRLREETRTEFMAEQAVITLLQHQRWRRRTFRTIRAAVGGFSDDELRQLLVRAGALRYSYDDETEVWGLISRNTEWINSSVGDASVGESS
jgi:hypothetical protein